jgi:hypothetical protein
MWMNDWGWEDRQLFLAERRLDKVKRTIFREKTLYRIVAICVLCIVVRMVLS